MHCNCSDEGDTQLGRRLFQIDSTKSPCELQEVGLNHSWNLNPEDCELLYVGTRLHPFSQSVFNIMHL